MRFHGVAEVRQLFDSIEKANPRLYKVIQNIPAAARTLRNSHHENRSLPDIEEDLGEYVSVDLLREHLSAFFHHARGYVETHNPRKLDELDSLMSELDFV
uniref:Uncharacterized protein n=1 Tax=Caenorhabditis japonica TaxID=281687 RepID=A0A8R1IB45_CAEJA